MNLEEDRERSGEPQGKRVCRAFTEIDGESIMKKYIALSTAVLAATFTFAPLAGAQTAQQRAQEAQQQAQQNAQNAQQRAQQAGQKAGAGAQAAADQMQNPDPMFAREAAADNLFEIQAGQNVEQKAQNQQVKQLAQRLVQDHQRAQQQLEQAAQQDKIQLPTSLEDWQQAKLQHMEKHQGQQAEMNFAFGQVGDHTADILKYRYEAEHGQNAQLKQYAQQQIPILEEHLQLARQAAEQWVPEARTAGERIQGTGTGQGQGLNGTNGNQTGSGAGAGSRSGTNTGVNR